MKRTYYGTLLNRDLPKANIKLEVTDKVKWEAEESATFNYTGIRCWDLIEGGKEADLIEKALNIVDENHEYLVLHFTDERILVFRNSHVVMFVL